MAPCHLSPGLCGAHQHHVPPESCTGPTSPHTALGALAGGSEQVAPLAGVGPTGGSPEAQDEFIPCPPQHR